MYEEHHVVTITDEAVVAGVKLSKRYINDRFLPDKAIDLIDEASSKTRLDAYVMPDEIKTLEAQIEQLTKDKEEAIKSEAYEQAGEIKKKQLKKKEQLEKMTKQWQDSINENNLIVDEDEIASEGRDHLKGNRIELSEEGKQALSQKISQLRKGQELTIKYFTDGYYENITGILDAVDAITKELRIYTGFINDTGKELPTIIAFEDILEIGVNMT